MSVEAPTTLTPAPSFRSKVEELSGQKISACYQCEKCSNGCPVAFAMDIVPHKVMRLVQYGQLDSVLSSDTIWVSASCETCTTRCPNGIDIAHVMDSLRQLAVKEDMVRSQRNAPLFHSEFLSSIKRFGRVHELSMISLYTLKSEGPSGLLRQAGMGLDMLRKGKFKLLPHSHGKGKIKKIFRASGGDGNG